MATYISGKKYSILTSALVVVLSLFLVVFIVQASSTIGTNLSTTGTLTVSGLATFSVGASSTTNFEAVGYASVGGNTTVGGTLGVTGVTTLSSRLSGTAASLSTNFEAVGYASISGNLEFGGSGTHTLGVNSGSGALTINAFTLGGAVTGGSNNITGLGNLTATNASVSNRFEVSTAASISQLFANTMFVAGGGTASLSSGLPVYVADFNGINPTATTSVNFNSGTNLGTCLQLKDSTGKNVYLRIIGGATGTSATNLVSVSTKSCR